MMTRAYASGSICKERRKGYEVWMGQVHVDGKQRQKPLGRVRRTAKGRPTRGLAEREVADHRRRGTSVVRASFEYAGHP